MPTDEQVVSISEEALSRILDVRSREPDAEELALCLSVAGVQLLDFVYELTFVPLGTAGEGDALADHGGLPVIVPADSIERLRGAELYARDGSLAIDNPNGPIPRIEPGSPEAAGSIAERVASVLDHHINPAIAGHGGWAELDSVDGETVYLRLGGGCQGCAMAQMTLRHGIEAALRKAVPEIGAVIDATDHTSGDNPYY